MSDAGREQDGCAVKAQQVGDQTVRGVLVLARNMNRAEVTLTLLCLNLDLIGRVVPSFPLAFAVSIAEAVCLPIRLAVLRLGD